MRRQRISRQQFVRLTRAMVSSALLVAAFALARPVAAQAPPAASTTKQPTSQAKDELARELYQRGDDKYGRGDYRGAARDFERAYELSGRPALLYNLGNVYEKLTRYDDALRSLRAYLPIAPDARKVEVEARIVKLEPLAATQRAAVPVPAPAGPPPTAAEATPLSGQTIAGISLLAVGALGMGVGAVFGGAALGARSDAQRLCPQVGAVRECTDDARGVLADDERYSLAADIGLLAGGAALALGAGLLVAELVGQDDAAADGEPEVATAALAAPRLTGLGAAPLAGGGVAVLTGQF